MAGPFVFNTHKSFLTGMIHVLLVAGPLAYGPGEDEDREPPEPICR